MINRAVHMQYINKNVRIMCLDRNRKVFVRAVVCGADLSALPLASCGNEK